MLKLVSLGEEMGAVCSSALAGLLHRTLRSPVEVDSPRYEVAEIA